MNNECQTSGHHESLEQLFACPPCSAFLEEMSE